MLTLQVPIDVEHFDEVNNEFIIPTFTLELEHSLVSISKWEAFFEKPFISDDEKTAEETLWYVRAMAITPNVPTEIFDKLTNENVERVNEYISSRQSATWFREDPSAARNREVITSEVIYFWMVHHRIPFECQYWHLNRLITLVRVCNEKNKPAKKMNQRDMLAHRRRLNAQRQQQHGTRG